MAMGYEETALLKELEQQTAFTKGEQA